MKQPSIVCKRLPELETSRRNAPIGVAFRCREWSLNAAVFFFSFQKGAFLYTLTFVILSFLEPIPISRAEKRYQLLIRRRGGVVVYVLTVRNMLRDKSSNSSIVYGLPTVHKYRASDTSAGKGWLQFIVVVPCILDVLLNLDLVTLPQNASKISFLGLKCLFLV
jgi:hypothetical protein